MSSNPKSESSSSPSEKAVKTKSKASPHTKTKPAKPSRPVKLSKSDSLRVFPTQETTTSSSTSSTTSTAYNCDLDDDSSMKICFVVMAVVYFSVGIAVLIMAIMWGSAHRSPFSALWGYMLMAGIVLLVLGITSLVSIHESCLRGANILINFATVAMLCGVALITLVFSTSSFEFINTELKLDYENLSQKYQLEEEKVVESQRKDEFKWSVGFSAAFFVLMFIVVNYSLWECCWWYIRGNKWLSPLLRNCFLCIIGMQGTNGVFAVIAIKLISKQTGPSAFNEVISADVTGYILAPSIIWLVFTMFFIIFFISWDYNKGKRESYGDILCSHKCKDSMHARVFIIAIVLTVLFVIASMVVGCVHAYKAVPMNAVIVCMDNADLSTSLLKCVDNDTDTDIDTDTDTDKDTDKDEENTRKWELRMNCERLGASVWRYSNSTGLVPLAEYRPCYDFAQQVDAWVQTAYARSWVINMQCLILATYHVAFVVFCCICFGGGGDD